jgi:hypothetical protein
VLSFFATVLVSLVKGSRTIYLFWIKVDFVIPDDGELCIVLPVTFLALTISTRNIGIVCAMIVTAGSKKLKMAMKIIKSACRLALESWSCYMGDDVR